MKTSEIFAAAKPFLAMNPGEERNGKTEFICHAIERTRASQQQKKTICEMIEERLSGLAAGSWLARQRGVCIPDNHPMDIGLAKPAVQQWRQAWLDRLIAEFEAKGD